MSKSTVDMHVRVAGIVLNYRTPDMTIKSIRSLSLGLDPAHDVIVVVDNHSEDCSVEQIGRALESIWGGTSVLLIESPENGGFSYGNNIGISQVNAEAYLLLNSDAYIEPGAVDVLLTALNSDKQTGIVGPLVCGEDGAAQVSCFNNRTPWNELLRTASTGFITKLLGLFGIKEVAQYPEGPTRDVDWLSFVSVLIRGETLQDVGLMDDGYFMYLEDNDFCRRCYEHGWKVSYVPSAHVVHANRGWSGRSLERQPRFYYESRTRYFHKYYGLMGWFLANMAWSVGRIISLLRESIERRPSAVPPYAWRDIWTLRHPVK